MPHYKFFIFFYFHLEFLKGVQNSKALHAQIFLITYSLGGQKMVGGSYADFVESLAIQ
jgi:hypothetical protein